MTHSSVAYPRSSPGKRDSSCLGWLTRVLLGGFLLSLLLMVAGLTAAGLLVYAQLGGQIEDGLAALSEARSRESFGSARITDRYGVLLWEIFRES